MDSPALLKDAPQPLTDHLEELRSRLIWCVSFVAVFTVAGWYGVDPLLAFMARPVGNFVFLGPADALFLKLKVAVSLGILFSMPVIFFHAWRFVEKGLLHRERTITSFLLPASMLLFLGGASLAMFAVSPVAVRFLLSFGGETLKPFISLQSYLSFLFWMVLGFGLLFQLPLAVLFSCQIGLVKPSVLSAYRRHVIVGLLVVAAVLTPGPDIFSQLILTIPTYVLFEISLLLARVFEKK